MKKINYAYVLVLSCEYKDKIGNEDLGRKKKKIYRH